MAYNAKALETFGTSAALNVIPGVAAGFSIIEEGEVVIDNDISDEDDSDVEKFVHHDDDDDDEVSDPDDDIIVGTAR